MGHSTTPTFRLEARTYAVSTGRFHTMTSAWNCNRLGRPNAYSLVKKVREFEQSTQQGGANAHLGVTVISTAKVVRQSTGEVVASWTPAPFKAVA